MRIPAYISLEDSYVLTIKVEPYRVTLEVDFVLLPEHDLYRQPMKGERECFRKGQLRIDEFDRMQWVATRFKPSEDASGEFDFGTFDQVVCSIDSIKLLGDWGELEIFGGVLSVQLIEGQ